MPAINVVAPESIIKAIQYTGQDIKEFIEFLNYDYPIIKSKDGSYLRLATTGGFRNVELGYWIIIRKCDVTVMSNSDFEETYVTKLND